MNTNEAKRSVGEIQSVIFPKESFKVGESRKWLKKNDFIWNGKVDREYRENYFSFRQTEPLYKRYISKKLPNGVILIIGYS